MISASEHSHRRLAWLLILLGLAARLLLAGGFLLAPEEANVWRFSRVLAAGYPEHPPLLVWAIHSSTAIFGHNEVAVRLPTILGFCIAGIYLNLLTARWGSWRSACHMQLLLQGLLLSNGLSLVATPDGLLLPCWAGALYHAFMALEQRRTNPVSWLWTGFWFGLGLLCKFTAILFLPSLLVTLAWAGRTRQTLGQSAPWLGLLLALALQIPLLSWNWRHDWLTTRHFIENLHLTLSLSWRPLLDFLAAQAALLSPLLLPLIWLSWGSALSGLSTREHRLKQLAWFSLLPFGVILLLSSGSRGHSTWSAPAYLSALVLTTLLFAPKPGGRVSWIWLTSLLSAWGITLLVLLQAITSLLPIPLPLDRTAREISGWRTLARTVDKALLEMPRPDRTFVFSDERYLADELSFYLTGQPETSFFHPWRIPPDEDHRARSPGLPGGDAIGMLTSDQIPDRLQRLFATISPPQPVEIHRISSFGRDDVVATLYLVRATGFRGEERK